MEGKDVGLIDIPSNDTLIINADTINDTLTIYTDTINEHFYFNKQTYFLLIYSRHVQHSVILRLSHRFEDSIEWHMFSSLFVDTDGRLVTAGVSVT